MLEECRSRFLNFLMSGGVAITEPVVVRGQHPLLDDPITCRCVVGGHLALYDDGITCRCLISYTLSQLR
jgi:hypothetical protein